MKSRLEAAAESLLLQADYVIKPEHVFAPDRNWRADFLVWRDHETAQLMGEHPGFRNSCLVEIEGMPRARPGRHQHRTGFAKDIEKYNAAALLGWYVFRFTEDMLGDGTMERTLKRYFARRDE